MVAPNPLGQVIADAYTYAQSLVGLAVFFMFVYAGIQMLLGKRSVAISILKDAVIGTILLFSAYVILYSINHDLVGQQSTEGLPLPGQQP